MKKVNIGVVGCGNISGIYFKNLTQTFLNTQVYSCADLIPERADNAAKEWHIPLIQTFEEMIADDKIDIILNITPPQKHYDLTKKALLAGKHVYVEKPLALSIEEGDELTGIAEKKGLLLGCAPDTFMGAGIQTCRKLIDDGYIGEPVGATAFMLCHGHESWHPAPEFYYQKGGGPMFDMGPYYVTALVNLMGGVQSVSGMTRKSFETRTITSQPLFGKVVEVEVPTHVTGLLQFDNDAIATIITSFDVWSTTLPRIEIYGTKGSLIVPDPNTFGGPVLLSTLDGSGFKEIPLTHQYPENSRGFGLSDMAQCLLDGRKDSKAGGALANHVLEIMCGIHLSGESGQVHPIKNRYQRSAPVSGDLIKGYVR